MNPAANPAAPTDHAGLPTRLTQGWGLQVPIVLAPMALASGGALAVACARAGALGLIGGGYGDLAWTQRELQLALQLSSAEPTLRDRLGIGFITWKMNEDASALDWALSLPPEQRPRAVMLSFGDPRPYAQRIHAAGARLICQIQRVDQLPAVLQAGAEVVVAQGAEAGGHGMNSLNGRASMTLVPELADRLAAQAPHTLLLAAGGVADGRGLAAALALGADGVLLGSRLWASQESLAAPGAKQQALETDGDGTARSAVFDILRRKNWPAPYDFRAIRNAVHRQWEHRVQALSADPSAARAAYDAAVAVGDFNTAHATVGEAVGLVHDLPAAAELVTRIATQARQVLGSFRL